METSWQGMAAASNYLMKISPQPILSFRAKRGICFFLGYRNSRFLTSFGMTMHPGHLPRKKILKRTVEDGMDPSRVLGISESYLPAVAGFCSPICVLLRESA